MLDCIIINYAFTTLQVNPVKRITIQGILEHEWFKVDFPEHLFPPLGDMTVVQIDSSVIAEVCQKLKVPAADVLAAVKLVALCTYGWKY